MKKKAKFLGVCADVADRLKINLEFLRAIFLCAFMLTGFQVIWVYLILYLLLDPKKD
jgi:phage shock protein PspC (stress-responsive transcriptional regulator)